jgi:hypothetical protein
MKKITIRILNMFIFGFAAFAASFAHAGSLGNIVGEYLANKQMSNSERAKAAAAKSLMQNYGSNQVQLRGIELTQEWQELYRLAEEASQQANVNMVNAGQSFDFCNNPNILQQLNQKPQMFDYAFNAKLPRKANNPANVFNYSTWRELNRFNSKYTGLQPVQIPNANAINTVMNLPVGGNVYENSSAIMLPNGLVEQIRIQYNALGRNHLVDSQNLHVATMRDIATIGYIIMKNPQSGISFDDFFITSMLVYTRNKVMCLYDAPVGHPMPF